MSQQRPRGGLNIAPPPLGLDKSGNIDLKAMLDQGIIPKRELATAMVRTFLSVVFLCYELSTKHSDIGEPEADEVNDKVSSVVCAISLFIWRQAVQSIFKRQNRNWWPKESTSKVCTAWSIHSKSKPRTSKGTIRAPQARNRRKCKVGWCSD
jgi:hypothetical protein